MKIELDDIIYLSPRQHPNQRFDFQFTMSFAPGTRIRWMAVVADEFDEKVDTSARSVTIDSERLAKAVLHGWTGWYWTSHEPADVWESLIGVECTLAVCRCQERDGVEALAETMEDTDETP